MNEALLEYIDHKLNNEDLGRVFPVTFQGNEYFVKRAVGNNRSNHPLVHPLIMSSI